LCGLTPDALRLRIEHGAQEIPKKREKRFDGRFNTLEYRLLRFGVLSEKLNSHAIYLDYDRIASPRLAPLFAAHHILGFSPTVLMLRKTRHGWHVVASYRRQFSPIEAIAMQAALGSDRKRETLNLMRALNMSRSRFWRARSNILYSHKVD